MSGNESFSTLSNGYGTSLGSFHFLYTAIVMVLPICYIFIHRRNKHKLRLPNVITIKLARELNKKTKEGRKRPNHPLWFLEIARSIGKYTFTFPKVPFINRFVIVGDAKMAREMLMDSSTSRPPAFYRKLEIGGAINIFTREGESWHARRTGVKPAFHRTHIERMNQVACDSAEKWIREKLIPWCADGTAFDVSLEMTNIILEAICRTMFEYDLSEEERIEFLENNELYFAEFLGKSYIRKYIPLWFIPERKRATEAYYKVMELMKRFIANYRSNPNPLKGTIIDCIMNNPCYENDNDLCFELFGYVMAGYDTTAFSIAWALLELARNPHEQEKVRESIKNTTSKVATSTRNEVLLRAIKESMRLNPVLGLGSCRLTGRDFVNKEEGYIVPKGTIFLANIMLMHRNEKVYGSNVDQYLPSRWENATKAQRDHLMSFSAGRQNCVGQVLANAELYCILHRILSEFRLFVETEETSEVLLTMKPEGAMLRAERIVQ